MTKVQSFYSPPIQALLTINMEIDMSSMESNFIVYNPPLGSIEAAFMTFLGLIQQMRKHRASNEFHSAVH